MADENDLIFDSAPSNPDDDFWLEHGKKMVGDAITAVREAAKALLTGLGLMQSIYLGILGFADFIPKTLPLTQKVWFIIPPLFWLMAIYCSLRVMMTQRLDINLHAPEDIRDKSEHVLLAKQNGLHWAFWTLTIGLVAAFALLIMRWQTTAGEALFLAKFCRIL